MKRIYLLCVILIACMSAAFAQSHDDRKEDGHEGATERAAAKRTAWTIHVGSEDGQDVFVPAELTGVHRGDEISFIFHSTHTATSDDLAMGDPKRTFNTGKAIDGQTVTLFVNYEGTFNYHCEYHDDMKGKIVVGP